MDASTLMAAALLGAAGSLGPSHPPIRQTWGSSLGGKELERKRADRKRARQARRAGRKHGRNR